MKNWNMAIGVCVGAVLGFAVDRALIGKSIGPIPGRAVAAGANNNGPAAAPPGSEQIYKAIVGGSPSKGPADAKVTVVEFSDFQCPFCGRVIDTVHQVQKAYGNDLRVVFKNNPLPMHPDAPFAARASVAANKQGKFWEMHDKLFDANVNRAPMNRAAVEKMAKDIPGLDFEQWKTDADSSEAGDLIASDQAQATQLGANGTPTFFINGAKVAGAMPFESFKAVIDVQLKRADDALSRGVAKSALYETLTKDGITSPPPPPGRPPQAPPPAQVRKVDPGVEAPAKGGKHAKVTIVEWSDFQCPFCSRVEPALKQVFDTYKDDVRLVWRNEPLGFHPNAMPAAKAAMAAHKQGKFWAMHDLMFDNQGQLSEDSYEKWAKQIGLNLSKWKKDKDSPEVADAINKDSTYGSQVGADGTPTFFINGKVISGAMPFDSFKSVIDEQLEKANDLLKKGTKQDKLYDALVAENMKAAPGANTAQVPQAPDAPAKIDVGDSPVLGPKNAPVTVVVFSDFQCPYCGRVEPTLQQIRDEYKGKIKMVWKNQPLPFHPNAMPAAEAAMAAAEQGKFWEMHDRLFAKQTELSPQLYDQIATELGLDMDRFHTALQSHKFQSQIQSDSNAGNAVGANGTPTFFINGRKLIGAQPFDSFKQVIDSELASAVAKK